MTSRGDFIGRGITSETKYSRTRKPTEHVERKTMRTLQIRAALLASLLFVSTLGFSQSSNGTISGTVSDASKAVIPGVEISATNSATGVVTTVVSNDAGAYTVVGLLPGTYKVSAVLPGFRT